MVYNRAGQLYWRKAVEVKRAVDFDESIREKISEIFVDAYAKDLQFFSKDKNTLIKAFTHMFMPEYFHIAVIDNEIAGMAVCIDTDNFCIHHNKKILIKYLGLVKGLSANIMFKYYFNKLPKYPMETDEKTASVEFVATRSQYRKKGVASAIIHYLFTLPQYKDYILEVADTNTNAFELYKKLGFKEIYRKELKVGKKYAGLNAFVYMKYSKPFAKE
jgi:ribosomal protein S18 acetylase RimI-like enzyme